MKNTDKVTMTVGQLKKLVKESSNVESLTHIVNEMKKVSKDHYITDMEVDDALAEIPLDDYADRISEILNAIKFYIKNIKDINDQRPHDSYGYEINDYLEELNRIL